MQVKKEKNKSNNKSTSKVLIAFIVILIVLFISIIGYVIYRYFKLKMRTDIKKEDKKIEYIEEFNNMN